MAKVDLDIVKYVLEHSDQFDVRQVAGLIEQINKAQEEIDSEKPKTPTVKKQFVILVSDPNNELPDNDFVGWVAQIPEDDSPATTEERLHKAAYEFNTTPRGRKLPVTTIGEACESVPARLLKENDVWVKTKEPVLIVKSNNAIPMDDLKSESRQDI